MSDNDGLWMDRRDQLFEQVVRRGRARRRRRAFIVTASALTLLIALAVGLYVPANRPTSVRVAGPGSTSTTLHSPRTDRVLLIGDSLMLGAKEAIERAIPGARVDAAVSRQFDQGATFLETDLAGGPARTVVVDLGDNGAFGDDAFDRIMRAAGPDATVVFLTVKVPRSWEQAVNDALYAGARRWANARVLDWQHYSSPHADWFLRDGFHLSAAGQAEYAAFIDDDLRTTDIHQPVTSRGASATSAYVLQAMNHTVEVDAPAEHFMPHDLIVSTLDATGGTVDAVVGVRTPTADGKGQLVFFFHNGTFVGWDAPQEAISIIGLASPGPRAIAVTYANYGPLDPIIGASLPPATVIYRWDGHHIAPDTQPPPGAYQLNDPGVHARRVKLLP